jgi:molybdopterin-synthase adenylyltransferase
MEHDSQVRFKSLPAQIIPAGATVVLKRGCIEIRFQGSQYADRLALLLKFFRSGSTEQEFLSRVEEAHRSETHALLRLLTAKNFIIPVTGIETQLTGREPHLDVFYWHFEPQPYTIVGRLQSRRIVLLGDNSLTRELSQALALSGFGHITAVAYPLPESPHKRTDREAISSQNGWCPIPHETWIQTEDWRSVDCLVATSDVGGRELLRQWNELAIRQQCHFLPVVLQDALGFIGPLVIPGETACYECLVARENSHIDDPELHRTVERAAYEGSCVAGFHPLMVSVLSSLAAFELMKFYAEMVGVRNVGTMIEVDLLATRIMARKVLKLPRCMMCSSLLNQPSISCHKPLTSSGTTRT